MTLGTKETKKDCSVNFQVSGSMTVVTAFAISLGSLFLEATVKPTATYSLFSEIGTHHKNCS